MRWYQVIWIKNRQPVACLQRVSFNPQFSLEFPTKVCMSPRQGPAAISLLSEFLKLDWRKRINAIDALKHPYFLNPPLPAKPGDLPRFEDSHELDRRKFRDQKAALPPAPAGGSVGMGPNGEWTTGSGARPGNDQRSSRIPGVTRADHSNFNGIPGRRPRVPHDSRVPDSYQAPKRQASLDPHPYPLAVPGDVGLPPKPPTSHHQPWMSGRRDQMPPSRVGGRPDGKLDSYVPKYDDSGDRPRVRDTADAREGWQDRSRHGDRREHNPPRRRSRSPDPRSRDMARDADRRYNLYRR